MWVPPVPIDPRHFVAHVQRIRHPRDQHRSLSSGPFYTKRKAKRGQAYTSRSTIYTHTASRTPPPFSFTSENGSDTVRIPSELNTCETFVSAS